MELKWQNLSDHNRLPEIKRPKIERKEKRGGAHGLRVRHGICIALRNGKRIKLQLDRLSNELTSKYKYL